ncbi:MAG: IS3 family transposase [Cumulibacter sp.]
MIAYIETYRDRFGVECICRVLGATDGGFITARGYRSATTRPASARAVRDEQLLGELVRIYRDNYSVYGVRKMHAAMRRAGWLIGRDQTARLMRIAGICGITRGASGRTTTSDPALERPDDLVQRNFRPAAPRCLWVADITYVPTWSGMAYAAFVIDAYSRRIAGWTVASSMRTEDLPLQALDQALWRARDTSDLVHHSDRGSQGGFNWSSQHLDRGGVCSGDEVLVCEDERGSGRGSTPMACRSSVTAADALARAA